MGPTVLLPLSESTRESNHLQMSLQRQHFLLSSLKTQFVGLARVGHGDLFTAEESAASSLLTFTAATLQLFCVVFNQHYYSCFAATETERSLLMCYVKFFR